MSNFEKYKQEALDNGFSDDYAKKMVRIDQFEAEKSKTNEMVDKNFIESSAIIKRLYPHIHNDIMRSDLYAIEVFINSFDSFVGKSFITDAAKRMIAAEYNIYEYKRIYIALCGATYIGFMYLVYLFIDYVGNQSTISDGGKVASICLISFIYIATCLLLQECVWKNLIKYFERKIIRSGE